VSTLAAPAGTSLGRYQILKHLASGGMAEIYLARATGIEGFERYVVVKRILAEHAADKRFVKMFTDEARLAAQLHHQNIAQVYDCGQDDGTYYFAMEYVHGENLRELLKKMALARRQLPLEHALTIIAGGCAGLDYAHDKRGADRQPLGVVHRDVSPSNLIVAYDGGVKVVDFGIAKAASRMSETRSGTLKGKIAYMSPEQCLGKSLDRRSDIFALGIVMYELTTVSRLFKGENDYITMNRIVTGDIPSPTKKRPDYPPALEAIVMKALALDPVDRYQTAGELLEAIEQFATRERISLSTTALGRFMREVFGERPEPWQDLSASSSSSDPSSEDNEVVDVTRSNVGGNTAATTPLPIGRSTLSTASASSIVAPPRRSIGAWIFAGLAVTTVAVVGVITLSSNGAGSSGTAAPGSAPSPAPSSSAPAPSGSSLAPPPVVPAGSAAPVVPPGPVGARDGSAATDPPAGSAAPTRPPVASSGRPNPGRTGKTPPRGGATQPVKPPVGSAAPAGSAVVAGPTEPGPGSSAPPPTGAGAGTGSAGATTIKRDPRSLFPPKE
jgi:serine/threonine protein kinase